MVPKLKFPEIKEPSVLAPEVWKEILENTQRYVKNEILKEGGESFYREFAQIGSMIERIRHTPFAERVLLFGLGRQAGMLFDGVRQLANKMPEFVPIRELEADAAYLIAEFAELVFRRAHSGLILSPEEAARETIREDLKRQVGLTSIDDVIKLFESARNNFQAGVSALVRQAREMQRTGHGSPLFPIAEQLVSKHIVATLHLFVLRMAVKIHQLAPETELEIASLAAVAPYLGSYPQAREEISGYDLASTYSLIGMTMDQTFNQRKSVVGFYTNTGNLAALLGEYGAARKCYEIAARFAGESVPPEIRRGQKIVSELDPRLKA